MRFPRLPRLPVSRRRLPTAFDRMTWERDQACDAAASLERERDEAIERAMIAERQLEDSRERDDLIGEQRDEARARVAALEAAIREHRETLAKPADRYNAALWDTDRKLWSALDGHDRQERDEWERKRARGGRR